MIPRFARPSVVVPLGRIDAAFAECLGSIARQSLPPQEIIVVADGLPDAVGHAREWSELARGPVRVVPIEKGGVAAALNRGLHEARSDVIVRMDSDDEMLPERIERQAQIFASEPHTAVVGGHAVVIGPEGAVIGHRAIPSTHEAILSTLLRRNPLIHPAVAFRRSDVIAAGGYRTTMTRVEDYDLWLRLALRGCVYRASGQTDIRYRVHSDQHSKSGPVMNLSQALDLETLRWRLGRMLGVPSWKLAGRSAAWQLWNNMPPQVRRGALSNLHQRHVKA